MTRKIIAGVIAASAIAASALPAFAHEAVNFEPGPNCMGELTSFHAKDPGNGLRHNAEGMKHKGIADELGVDPASNFQEFMKLNHMWCKSYKDAE